MFSEVRGIDKNDVLYKEDKNPVVSNECEQGCRYRGCDAWRTCALAEYRGTYEIDALRKEVSVLKDNLNAWKHAIEGLTPGGSEFVNDPERCAEFIRYKCSFPKKMISMQSRIDELEAEKIELMVARGFSKSKEDVNV